MYAVGEKIIYGEQGACEVSEVGHVAMQGIAKDRLFYTLRPLSGGGTIYAPVDSPVYTSHVMAPEEAKAFLAAIPSIEATYCTEVKVTKADAYYKSIFSSHSREALIAMLKGLKGCSTDRRQTLNLRLERISKRARDLLESELSAALGISTADAQKMLAEALTK